MHTINYLAVVAAAASSFMLGGLWYSKALFETTWKREAGDSRRREDQHPGKVFGFSFILALLAALAYACLVGPAANAGEAAMRGLEVGGIVAAAFGINYLFANRSLKLWLIDGGYHLLQLVIYGLIIGLWH